MPHRGYRFVETKITKIVATLVATLRDWVATDVAKIPFE